MKRREFLAVVSLPALTGASISRAQSDPVREPGPVLASPPVVQHPAEDGFTVSWQVHGPATGWVTWGTAPDQLDRVARPGGPGLLDVADRFLSVRVSGVPAQAREVYYQVHAEPIAYRSAYQIDRGPLEAGPIRRLRLPRADQSSLKLAVINDTHENEATLIALSDRLAHHQPDALLWNGDTSKDFYEDDRLGAILLGPGADSERPGWGGWAATRPLFFVPGNHDVRGPRARTLHRALPPWPVTIDPEAAAAASGPPRCFARRLGPVAFIGLDTGEDKPDRRDIFAGLADFEAWREAQGRWLDCALAREPIAAAPHLVVACHIPLRGLPEQNDGQSDEGYASYCGQAAACWLPALRRAGCSVLFSGHTHRHRIDPAVGDLPLQVVGGGPQPDRATLILLEADPQHLRIRVEDLAGNLLAEEVREARHPRGPGSASNGTMTRAVRDKGGIA